MTGTDSRPPTSSQLTGTQSRPARWRLFVAAPLPATTASQLWQSLAPLRQLHPRVRWSPASKLHLTLVFLGATDPREIESIGATVAGVVDGWSPFEVATGQGGGFLGERGGSGVAWLELAEGRDEAAQLALALDVALGSRAYERRPPRPHLTLARKVTPALLADVHAVDHELRTSWPIERAVIYRSHTGPGSADYEELASFPLAARQPSPPGGSAPAAEGD